MKRRNSSAFLVLFKAVFLAALAALTAFFMEVFFLGLLPVFELQLHNPAMWMMPAGIGVLIFLWNLSRNGLFRTFLTLVVCAALVCTTYFQNPGLAGFLYRTFMNSRIDLERLVHADDPEFEHTYLLRKDPFPIYYVDDGNTEQTISQAVLDNLSDYIASLPDILLQNCSAIYLMEEPAFEAMDASYENSSVFGLSKSSNFTIDIRLVDHGSDSYTYMHDGTPVSLDNPKFYTETIVHELVHLADMKSAASGKLASESEPYASWYQSDPKLFGAYGATSPAEWFAEAGVYYFMYPQMLYDMNPQLYQSLEEFFAS